MSKYMDKVLVNMDKVAIVKTKDNTRKQCESFKACTCGFCINYIGSRKKYFQNCAGKCKVKAY